MTAISPLAFIRRMACYAALWWVLTGGAPDGWGVGIVAAGLATVLSLRLHPPGPRRIAFAAAPRFLAFFLLHSARGGLQVAHAALRPRLDLKPALLDIPLRLPEQRQQMFLAGMLSLMPGTLGAGLERGRLQLHVLDRRLPMLAEVRAAEGHVARLFGVTLQ